MATPTAVALGSNLGDRLHHLQSARNSLRKLAVPGTPYLQASIYQTAPIGCPEGSPDFFNTLVEFHFDGTPEELLVQTQRLERMAGREQGLVANAPRPLDLDILYFGALRLRTDQLEIPHPRMTERRFVLEPLAEIQPNFVLPGQQQSAAELLNELTDAPVRLVFATW
ncbi:MAG: 2-amino-4-hydroxy-6-hydroxymethyldihydropteridine diphosphokinase [Verrucomicrobiales bacterium]